MIRSIMTGLLLLLIFGQTAFAGCEAKPAAASADEAIAAYRRLEPLAAAGDACAQFIVGEMHRDGPGVRYRDPEAAAYWFRLAGAQGLAEANYALGRLHYEGFLVPRDVHEMLVALGTAAAAGHAQARLTLGVIHEYGLDSLRADLTQALTWYELAAEIGGDNIERRLALLRERVRDKMTPVQISTALRNAADRRDDP